MTGLRAVVDDAQLELLRLLVDRRRRLGEDHTRMVCQLHQLLLELIPGGAKRDLSAAQARRLLAGVRPRDVVDKTRKQHAMELVVGLERIYQRKKAANKELIEVIESTGTGCSTCTGSAPPAPPGCWSRSATSPGSPRAARPRLARPWACGQGARFGRARRAVRGQRTKEPARGLTLARH
jgi:hypothetical protein